MFRQEHKDGECAPNRAGYCQCPLKDAEEEAEAELICSDTDRGMHLPVIDIDFPIRAVPSATKGHFHLYIHKPVEWGPYLKVLEAMAEAGLVQWQWVNTTRERGYSSVRHPDKPKEKA